MREAASIIARLAHKGQLYGGRDYYEAHILQVVRNVEEDEFFAGTGFDREIAVEAAYLHDTIEDTFLTTDCLMALGIRPTVVALVDCLTKREGEKYEEYIERVSCDWLARIVKKADLKANLANNPPTRLRIRYGGAMARLLRSP